MTRSIICVGDTTTHGGVVVEGDYLVKINGRPVSRKGDKVICPKCENAYIIIEGDSKLKVNGRALALEQMQTSCGARLLSNQSIAKSK